MVLNVNTDEASNIYLDAAQLNGELSVLSGTESDVLFSLQESGTVSWQNTISGSIPYSGTKTDTQTLIDVGKYSYTVNDLSPNTNYEFRALAESAGEVDQGSVKTFTTMKMQDIYTHPDLVNFVFNGARDERDEQNLSGKERLAVHNIALRHVDPIINTKLSQRFDVPFEPYPDVPAIIQDISTKLTVYYFVNFPGGGSDQAQYVEELKEQANDMLDGLTEGEMSLSDDPSDSDFDFNRAASETLYDQFLFVGHLQPPDFQDEFGDTQKVFDNRA